MLNKDQLEVLIKLISNDLVIFCCKKGCGKTYLADWLSENTNSFKINSQSSLGLHSVKGIKRNILIIDELEAIKYDANTLSLLLQFLENKKTIICTTCNDLAGGFLIDLQKLGISYIIVESTL